MGRGRDARYRAPPAQNRTCGFPAYGSHLRYVTASRWLDPAACRMRSSACDAGTRLCVRPVLCWLAFPLASALRSTNSSTDRSASFAGFTTTMASSDFLLPFITGYGSSPSRCGPEHCCQWPDAGSLKFRRAPFACDGLSDPGRTSDASHNGVTPVAFDYEHSLRSRE